MNDKETLVFALHFAIWFVNLLMGGFLTVYNLVYKNNILFALMTAGIFILSFIMMVRIYINFDNRVLKE